MAGGSHVRGCVWCCVPKTVTVCTSHGYKTHAYEEYASKRPKEAIAVLAELGPCQGDAVSNERWLQVCGSARLTPVIRCHSSNAHLCRTRQHRVEPPDPLHKRRRKARSVQVRQPIAFTPDQRTDYRCDNFLFQLCGCLQPVQNQDARFNESHHNRREQRLEQYSLEVPLNESCINRADKRHQHKQNTFCLVKAAADIQRSRKSGTHSELLWISPG